jgi:hypothetical protein
LNSSSNTLENYWQQYDRPAVCIIALKYSFATFSATFVSLRIPSREEIFGATFKNVNI